MNTPNFGRCEHGLNPKACLQCFAQNPNTQAKPKPKPADPPRVVDPVVAAVRARAGLPIEAPLPGVPHVQAPVHVGSMPDGTAVAPPKKEEPNLTRGPMPKPVLHNALQPGQQKPLLRDPVASAFDYGQETGRMRRTEGFGVENAGSSEIWHPPKRKQLIDQLPRHPNPSGVKTNT